MKEKEAKRRVRECLEGEGFVVTEIERSSNRTPDFLIEDETECYVLELKQKESAPREEERFDLHDETGWRIYHRSDSTGFRSRLAAIILEAVEQTNAADIVDDH